MSTLEHLSKAVGAIALPDIFSRRSRAEDLNYGPALALGYPARGEGWYRPWGRIETTVISTRKSRRTLSVRNEERHIAILTTDGLTPALLASKTWRQARSNRQGRHLDAFTFPFGAVLVLGALLLGVALPQVASPIAVAVLLALAVVAGIAGLFRSRAAAAHAAAELSQAGHDWREIELGEDDAIVRLLWTLDALAFAWESGHVSDEVWATARALTRQVAEEARRGALIDDENRDLCVARDYVAEARAQIAASGRADALEAPSSKTI